ncbi:RNA-binding protein PNO1, partial [Glycine soja]
SYIVYLGWHSHGPNPSASDLEFATNPHYKLLGSHLGSHEKAKEAIFYSYNKHSNGFAVVLEEEHAQDIAKNPNVVSVFLNKGHELQTTRSWEFLGLESDGVVPKDSIWEKARYGEGVNIANIDTGQFLILIVKVKFFKGGGCFLSTIFPKQGMAAVSSAIVNRGKTPPLPVFVLSCRMESNQAASSMDVETVPSEVKLLPPKPKFEPLKPHEMSDGQVQFRKVNVPPHRYTPLKKAWMDIYTPIYEQMKIDVRMNLKGRRIELKTRPDTPDISNLQKCADFAHAFMLGFDVIDAIALLRLDELYIESFEIKDVKTLRGDHLSRAIGRLSGKGGKTKFAIENASKTRIVIADTKIHILGSFSNIKIARDSLCSLILGSPAGKVYSKLRAVTARLAERF